MRDSAAEVKNICKNIQCYKPRYLQLKSDDINPEEGVIDIYMYNLWQVSSYSYQLNISPELIEISDISGFLNAEFNQVDSTYIIQSTYLEQLINPNPDGVLLNTIFFETSDVISIFAPYIAANCKVVGIFAVNV